MIRATVTVAEPPPPASTRDGLAPLPRQPRGQDDPHGVDEARGEREEQAGYGRAFVRIDAADGEDHAAQRDPQGDPGPAPAQAMAEPERQHGDDRRVEVHDERGQRGRTVSSEA